MNEAIQVFLDVVEAAVPYALTWRIGTYIVNTLLDWVTGRSDKI